MRFFAFDVKRVFESRSTAALCVLAPALVMLLFSSIIAPLIFTAKISKFNVAICNEDKSEPVKIFINQMLNSQALKDLVATYPSDSVQDGLAMLESGDVQILVHVPPDLFNNMREHKKTIIDIYSLPGHQLETTLIQMTLNSSLSSVGKSQNLIESSQKMLLDKGVSQASSDQFVQSTTNYLIREFMDRREVLGQKGLISPIGGYLPTEYYMGAIFSLFAALAMIPLVRLTASDMNGAVIKRGLLIGSGALHFYLARLFSGFLFITLVLLMVFPTGFLSKIFNMAIQISFSSSFTALAAAVGLSALCYSAMAAAFAVWIPNEDGALWATFYLVLIMAMLCGALIPESYLPDWTLTLGKWLPLRSSMRTMISALFVYEQGQYLQDIYKLSVWTLTFAGLGIWGFIRRGNSL